MFMVHIYDFSVRVSHIHYLYRHPYMLCRKEQKSDSLVHYKLGTRKHVTLNTPGFYHLFEL